MIRTGWSRANCTVPCIQDQRDSCKAVALGRLYGQGIAGLSRTHGIPEDTARTITEAFDNAYPDLGKLRYRIEDKLLAHGVPCWTNALGRHQRLDPTMKYKAVNYLHKGSSRRTRGGWCRAEDAGLGHLLWVPIHDEIVVQAPEDQSEGTKQAGRNHVHPPCWAGPSPLRASSWQALAEGVMTMALALPTSPVPVGI